MQLRGEALMFTHSWFVRMLSQHTCISFDMQHAATLSLNPKVNICQSGPPPGTPRPVTCSRRLYSIVEAREFEHLHIRALTCRGADHPRPYRLFQLLWVPERLRALNLRTSVGISVSGKLLGS